MRRACARSWRAVKGQGLTGAGKIRYGPAMNKPSPVRRFHTPSRAFWTSERLTITELINHAACPDFSLALGRVEPGVTTQLHSLDVAETYSVKSGRGRIEIDGQNLDLGPGDSVNIAPGQAQRITNTGAGALEIHLVCRPRFTPSCYHNLENADEG